MFGGRRTYAVAAGLAALVALAAAGCGSTTTNEGGPDVREGEIGAEQSEQRLASRINLVLDDLPGAWRQLPTSASPPEELWECLTSARSGLTITGDVTSQRFGKGPMRIAGSLTMVFTSPEQAENAFERAFADDLGQCIATKVAAAWRPKDQPRLAEIWADEISFPSVGERSVAYRVTGTVQAQDASWDWFLDLVLVQHDRTLAVLIAGDAPTPFPAKLERKLARIIEARMERSPGNL